VVDGLLRAAVDMKARPEDALQNSRGQDVERVSGIDVWGL